MVEKIKYRIKSPYVSRRLTYAGAYVVFRDDIVVNRFLNKSNATKWVNKQKKKDKKDECE